MPRTNEPSEPALPEGHVRVRVLPLGDDKIFTGETTAKLEFPCHSRGDELTLPKAIADALEKRGFAEVL